MNIKKCQARCHLSREEGITLGRALKARAKKGTKMVVSASRFLCPVFCLFACI